MPIPTFTPGYPPDGASLGQTKATIRNNLDGTFETLAIDHIDNNGSPGSKPAGYHKIIHQVSQIGTLPVGVATVSGVNQVFSGIPGTLVVNSTTTPNIPSGGDTQLYSLSGAGILSQLTGKVTGGNQSNGYAWVGGILIQWGKSSIAAGTSVNGSVSFSSSPNVNFPNACFNVSLTLIEKAGGSSSSDNTFSIQNGSPTATGFTWKFNGSSGSYPNFFWTAIGN